MADHAPIAEVRAFAVARAGDRVLVAYVQAGDPYARGALRLATLRASASAGSGAGAGASGTVLERVGADRTLAPAALTVAMSWDPARGGGAIAYVVPRPHRGETPGRGGPRRPAEAIARAIESPLGPASLSAGDVMFQLLDAEGAPTGRPTLVFEENARSYRVALARAVEGTGWLLAWTGAIVASDEVQGTVRWTRLSDAGVARAFASDTGFAGQTGDALFVLPARGGGGLATIVFDGERCAATTSGAFALPRVLGATASSAPRQAGAPPPPATHERAGAPIACTPTRVWTALARADGTTSAPIEGPLVPRAALALVRDERAGGAPLLLAPRDDGALAVLAVDPLRGRVATTTTPRVVAPPSEVPDVFARAASLSAHLDGAGALTFATLAPARRRVLFGAQRAPGAPATVVQLAPGGASGASTHAIALAPGAAGAPPWLFAQTGEPAAGPLVFIDAARAAEHAAPAETPWPGDDRLRAALLRARAARAEYTRAESGVTPAASRPDAASNPALPGMLAGLRRLRNQWEGACAPLLERARWLARHGADAGVNELARETCELPPEPGAPLPPEGGGAAPAPAAQ